MGNYKCLNNNFFQEGDYKIVPIRFEDKELIRSWRNEQMYHLRQKKLLTKKEQEIYFNNVVKKLFNKKKPEQIIFSFLHNNICIGYGGLVHINWKEKTGEISFLINTKMEKFFFKQNWKIFLNLIEQVAFLELNFSKIYTFAYDLRKNLFEIIEECGYEREKILKNNIIVNEAFIDVIIHSKHNNFKNSVC